MTTTTTIHPLWAPVGPSPLLAADAVPAPAAPVAADDHLARVDALLKVYDPPTDDEWRAAYRKFVSRMVVAAHGHRKNGVPADQLRRTIRRARVTFEEIHQGYGLSLSALYPPSGPDRGVRAILEAQEGAGDGLWSASRREFVP